MEENIDNFNGITVDATGRSSYTCSPALAYININNKTTKLQINALYKLKELKTNLELAKQLRKEL